jgi:hypothetical protein
MKGGQRKDDAENQVFRGEMGKGEKTGGWSQVVDTVLNGQWNVSA